MIKKRYILISILIICILSNLSGCVPGDVKRQAEENRKQHEGEFVEAVEMQLGNDYVLSNVEGYIKTHVSDYSIFSEYTAEPCLSGTVEHDGTQYGCIYDFETGILSGNVYGSEIAATCAELMGMDRSLITYGFIIDQNRSLEQVSYLPLSIRDINGLMEAYRGKRNAIEIYIVTTEDIDDLDLTGFLNSYKYMKADFEVFLFESDELANADHFMSNIYHVQNWEVSRPVVEFGKSREDKDIFLLYNLNRVIRVEDGYDDKFGDYEIRTY